MKTALILLLILICATAASGAFDVNTGTISNESWRSGVPLGGMGCGKIEIMPDGSMGYYTGNNSWDRPTGILKPAFLAVFAEAGGNRAARVLRLAGKDEYKGVENIAGIDYAGWYPTADIKYNDPSLPVKVELLAWSPLIPHDATDSSLPVACLHFKVTNLTEKPAMAAILMAWPNLIGQGVRKGAEPTSLEGNFQSPITDNKVAGVFYSRAESKTVENPNVEGTYLVCSPSKQPGTVTSCNFDASATTMPFWESFKNTGKLTANPLNEGKPAAAISKLISLAPHQTRVIDLALVWHFPRILTVQTLWNKKPEFEDKSDTAGQAIDGDIRTTWSTVHPMCPGERFELDLGRSLQIASMTLNYPKQVNNYPRGYLVEVSQDGQAWQTAASNSNVDWDIAGHGALEIKFASPQNASHIRITQTGSNQEHPWSIAELRFYDSTGRQLENLDWKATSRLQVCDKITKAEDVGHYYSNRFNDAEEIADYIFKNQSRLLSQTLAWESLIRKSSLPAWLKLKMINGTFPIYACDILTKDGRFSVLESPVSMGGALGTMDQRMAAHAFYTQMFPELDQRELRQYARAQDLVRPVADGRISHFDGNINLTVGDPNVPYGVTDWPDLSCSWVMQVLKLYRWTNDRNFLDDMWPHVKRAFTWLKSADKDGDNIPEGGSTYDYDNDPRGAYIYTASCYLGALRAGIHMAKAEGDLQYEKKLKNQFLMTQRSIMTMMWNGKAFKKNVVPSTGQTNPNSFIAQLAGDWLSRLCGSGKTLSPTVIDSTIQDIIRRNVRPFNLVPPMEVTADGKIPISTCYLLQHEAYAGCEAINEGYTDDGLDVLKRIYQVAWETNKNPWHQPLSYTAPDGKEKGLVSYMTCPTTYHVLNALSGTTLDLPNKTLYISPKVGKTLPELHMPLFFSKFWMWLDYVPSKKTMKLKVLKTFGNPETIQFVSPEGEMPRIKLQHPFLIQTGKTLDLSKYVGKLVLYPRGKTVN